MMKTMLTSLLILALSLLVYWMVRGIATLPPDAASPASVLYDACIKADGFPSLHPNGQYSGCQWRPR